MVSIFIKHNEYYFMYRGIEFQKDISIFYLLLELSLLGV